MGSFSLWHWLILFGIVFWVWRAATRKPKAHAAGSNHAPAGSIAKIRGNGRYEVEVVGESFYAASFQELGRRHRPSSKASESFGDATLTLDDDNRHDPNAVSVRLEGLQVGHLSRDMARDFRAALARDGLTAHKQFAVSARLYWGGANQHFSVTLDLPQD